MVVPRSIQAALELGALGVIVRCGTCLNVAKFSGARAIRLFGADTLVVDVAKKCRCRCGARAKYSVADWKRYSRGGGPPGSDQRRTCDLSWWSVSGDSRQR